MWDPSTLTDGELHSSTDPCATPWLSWDQHAPHISRGLMDQQLHWHLQHEHPQQRHDQKRHQQPHQHQVCRGQPRSWREHQAPKQRVIQQHALQELGGIMDQPVPCSNGATALPHRQLASSIGKEPSTVLPGGETLKKEQIKGSLFCKFLLSDALARAILGKDGTTLRAIELISRGRIQLSAKGQFFPGTLERICIVGGCVESIDKAIGLILDHAWELASKVYKTLMLKMVVSDPVISKIISHDENALKLLGASTGCRINVSVRVPSMQERLVFFAGTHSSVARAAQELWRTIQAWQTIRFFPPVQEHLRLCHDDTNLPLGIWEGPEDQKANDTVPVIEPSQIKFYTKLELLLYLHKAAPREVLIRHELFGNVDNLLEGKDMREFVDAAMETWQLRGGVVAAPASSHMAGGASVDETTVDNIGALQQQDSTVLETVLAIFRTRNRQHACRACR